MTTTEVQQILVALARVEGKVEAIQADNKRGEDVHRDHESRIRALERVRWMIGGLAFVAGGGSVGAFVKVLGG